MLSDMPGADRAASSIRVVDLSALKDGKEVVKLNALNRAYCYLVRFELIGGGPHVPPCARALWRLRRDIEQDARFAQLYKWQGSEGTYVATAPMW